jgi:hypothetical protein
MEEMDRKERQHWGGNQKEDEYFFFFFFSLSWRGFDFYGVLCTAENRRI